MKTHFTYYKSSYKSSSTCESVLDEERRLQREEHKRRSSFPEEPELQPVVVKNPLSLKQPQKPKTSLNLNKPKKQKKPLTFDERLAMTVHWLQSTFPHLFLSEEVKPLKLDILQQLKQFYKNNQNKYPADLCIRSELKQFQSQHCYLQALQKGAPRYDIKGNICGEVTSEEEKAAQELLKQLESENELNSSN